MRNSMFLSVLLLSSLLMLALGGACSCEPAGKDPKTDPCAIVRCGYGATCRVVGGRAKCECPTVCPAIYQPVCGTDGKTYSNSCTLGVNNCRFKKNVQVAYEGECGSIKKVID